MHLLGHGDCRHIVLIPGSVDECYAMTVEALDLAQQFQTPVFVATDLDLGMNLWLTEPVRVPRQADPARQGAHRRPTSSGSASSSGTRTSTATASATGRSPAPSTRWPPTSPAAPATTRSRATASGPRTGRRTSTAWRGSSRRRARPCPQPVIEGRPSAKVGLIAYGSTHWAVVEGRDQLARGRRRDRVLPAPRPAVPDEVVTLHRRATSASTSSSRTATARSLAAARARARRPDRRRAPQRHALQRHADRRREHRPAILAGEGFEVAAGHRRRQRRHGRRSERRLSNAECISADCYQLPIRSR